MRWLLNIAAMTVGNYPDAVPDHLRVGPGSFAVMSQNQCFPATAVPGRIPATVGFLGP